MADRRNLMIFRAKQGLNQKEMAEKIGVSRSTYSDVENAKRNCSPLFLSKLQEAFNIPDKDMWALTKITNEEG